MAKEHEEYLRDLFFSQSDVYTGSELNQKLRERFPDLKPENARKVVQSATNKKIMLSSKPATFGHNQFAYYTPGYPMDYEYFRRILDQKRPSLKRVTDLLQEKRAITMLDIQKLAATTTGESKTKSSTLKQIVDFFIDTNMAVQITWNDANYLVDKRLMPEGSYTPEAMKAMKDREKEIKLDTLFIPIIINWLRKHHLVTNNYVQYRSKVRPQQGVHYNSITWDVIMHTKSTGYYDISSTESDDTHTCVAIDVKINSSYTNDDLGGFYDRIQIFRNSVKQSKKRRILPIILCNACEPSVKRQILNLNILCFDVGTLFGERIYDIISTLMDGDASDPDLFSNLSKISEGLRALEESGQQDNLGNLKGELFERMFYPIFETILNPIRIDYGVVYNNIEYDYVIETRKEYIVVELKGYRGNSYIKKGVFDKKTNKQQPQTVNWFLKHTFLNIKEKYRINPDNKPVKACYITSAMFSESAFKVLEEQNKSKLKPTHLDLFYDGNKLIQLLREHHLNSEADAIIKYYKPVLDHEDVVVEPKAPEEDVEEDLLEVTKSEMDIERWLEQFWDGELKG